MNKAFVKEPEQTDVVHCPRCGTLGIPVGEETLQAQLKPEALPAVASSAFFCPHGPCEVLYFDIFERLLTIDAAVRPIYPKDPTAPICGCFGLSTDDIDLDLAEGVVTRTKSIVARAKSAEARCKTMAASGQCCVAEVQRYYIQHRG